MLSHNMKSYPHIATIDVLMSPHFIEHFWYYLSKLEMFLLLTVLIMLIAEYLVFVAVV